MSASRPLRVLQLNQSDLAGGGAGVAGYNLHHALRQAGVDSRLCVGARTSDEAEVTELAHPPTVQRVLLKVGHEIGLNELAGVGAYGPSLRSLVQSVDVVHAHALQGGWFSYPAIRGVSARRPTVLTLHDMWAFTGHCSFSFECERWRTGCGHCPHPETYPAVRRDATWIEWRLKRAVWRRSDLIVVSPSRWLADQAADGVLGRFPIRVIPHGVDHERLGPQERIACRAELGVPDGNLVVMCAAASLAHTDQRSIDRKGTDLAVSALEALPPEERARTTVLLMGARSGSMAGRLRRAGLHVIDAGFVEGVGAKAMHYSAADVLLFPSRADNAPLVVLEALACGTPVLATDVGGVGEVVADGRTGVLVPAGDEQALQSALARLSADRDLLAAMRPACRALVEQEHSQALAVARHCALYEELVR